MGFTEPTESPRSLVRSYRTVSPLPRMTGIPVTVRRFALCCTFPGLTAGRRYRPSHSLEPGLSSSHRKRRPAIVPPTRDAIRQDDRPIADRQGSFDTEEHETMNETVGLNRKELRVESD